MPTKIDFPREQINKTRENSRFGKYRFPQDMGPNGMVIDFKSYSYTGTNQAVSSTARTSTSIVLPLPQQIQDAYNIIIQEAQLGFGGSAVVEAFSGDSAQLRNNLNKAFTEIQETGASFARGSVENITDTVTGAGTYAKFLSRNLLDSLPIDGLSLAVDVVNGTAVNPHTTLNFDGVNLKQFNFNWTFAPRSAKESEELKNITRKIRSHILPKYDTLPGAPSIGIGASNRALLKYPDLALIRFNGLAPGHYFQFKPGMVSSFTVDYSPNGNAILEGGKPAIVNVSMSFSEAQIHTSDDAWGSGDGSSFSSGAS